MGRHILGLATPAAVVVGAVLAEFASTTVPAGGFIRPVLISLVGSSLIWLMLRVVLRRSDLATAAATAIVAILVYPPLAFGVVGILMAGYGLHCWRRDLAGRLTTGGMAFASVLAVAFALVGIARVAPNLDLVRPAPAQRSSDAPSVYVVLLDGYARDDALSALGYDNDPFLRELELRGFDVYRDAGSNYSITAATVASMLNSLPIEEIVPTPPEDRSEQYRALHRSMNEGRAIAAVHEAGFQFVTLRSNVDHVAIEGDLNLARAALTSFEIHLLLDSGLASLLELVAPDWIAEQHRELVRETLAGWPEAGTGGGRLVLAHAMTPHPPFVFEADGSRREMPDCFPTACSFWTPWSGGRYASAELFASGYIPQVEYVNHQLLAGIDRLPDDTIVVLMSDHGSRASADESEHLRTFLAARTPRHPRLFGEAPAPLRWFPRLLNTYLGTALPEHEGIHMINGNDPFDLKRADP